MKLLRRLISRVLYRREFYLFPYEVACLHAFRTILGDVEKLIFDRQLARYDFVQRSPDGRHLAFYDEEDPSGEFWPITDLFADRSPPRAAARVLLSHTAFTDGKARDFPIEVFVFDGRFAGLEMDSTPPPQLVRSPLLALAPTLLETSADLSSLVASVSPIRTSQQSDEGTQ